MTMTLFIMWMPIATLAFGWLFWRNLREHSLVARQYLGKLTLRLAAAAILLFLLALVLPWLSGFAFVLHIIASYIIATTKQLPDEPPQKWRSY